MFIVIAIMRETILKMDFNCSIVIRTSENFLFLAMLPLIYLFNKLNNFV